ncbi:MAG TPA: tRNA pseudouridine(38-40) synthase TruA [Gammaproteobacteria bacterium]|jgi:tRNA pseudouridine38-40 synthase|nr:tRNA pseudouridine(38-40) synthase TruA [Gammaproteobacteria bacterium]
MTRYALGLEYDGTAFMGWQRQTHPGRTVQAGLEEALAKVADHPVEVTCAGRTDAGVHALGQVVHFDSEARRNLRGWLLGVNSNLPPDVAAGWIQAAPEDFHARFSAEARQYRYVILNRLTRPALGREAVTWVHQALDVERMQTAARHLLGRHDFSAFRSVDCQAKQPVRTLKRLDIHREGERVIIDVVADGFLHHMVRNITGVLLAVGDGRQETGWSREVLEGRDRTLGGVTAPAAGLSLMAVSYPQRYGIPLPEGALFSANL